MEHEIRFYLKAIKEAMNKEEHAFVPKYIVTAVQLPTGAIELAVNTEGIEEKIDYILDAYDEEMQLKTNKAVRMTQIMVVQNMASVTRCDSCGAVVPHEKSKRICVYNVNDSGSNTGRCLMKDICPACYKRVKEALENVKQANNE